MESTLDFEATRIPQIKQNKRLACRISRNKHMIEISPKVFVVGPTRARRIANSTKTKKDSPEPPSQGFFKTSPNQHSQGFFKTPRDHCKSAVDGRTTRR